jgi:hypothetical protein
MFEHLLSTPTGAASGCETEGCNASCGFQQQPKAITVPITVPCDKSFGEALELLRGGEAVARYNWVEGTHIKLLGKGDLGVLNQPEFVMFDEDGEVEVYVPLTDDILATDWAHVPA